jgi:HSP90 family molecular chaperone
MTDEKWPPSFTLDQEKILNLLTGDRFYSNPSAALREAVLNAIDAVHRRRKTSVDLSPHIAVTFNRDELTVTVADNGIGMSQTDVSALFTKVGASAATAEAKKESVGEFGIGVISYFMAGDTFDLQTCDGATSPIGLSFTREMLAGGDAAEIAPTQESQGTTVALRMRGLPTFKVCNPSKRANWPRPHCSSDLPPPRPGLSGALTARVTARATSRLGCVPRSHACGAASRACRS